MKLPPGKIPVDVLKEVVFKNLGAKRNEVEVGPSAGIDGAVINLGEKSLVISMDPITGATERIGWLAVNVNANDIATFGVEPAFLFSCMLLPERSEKQIVDIISAQMNDAAKDLGIAIVGGHCESTLGLAKPIVVGCVMGITQKDHYVTASRAKPGDLLILTKSAGIEGTAILAADRENQLQRIMSKATLEAARNYYKQSSVVKDALTAWKTGGVHAMHDPTEGGVIGGIYEMTMASNVGVKIVEEAITIRPETKSICNYFQIDPLQLISSGALLISAESKSASKIIRSLKQAKIPASVIGEFTKKSEKRIIIKKDGSYQFLTSPVSDHLWTALKR